MASRAQLNNLTKPQLINKAISLDLQRRSAWKEYYSLRDDFIRLAYPAVVYKEVKVAKDHPNFVLKALVMYQSEKNNIECPVCLDDFSTSLKDVDETVKKLLSLPCGHILCRECNKECFENNTVKKCPLCRQE